MLKVLRRYLTLLILVVYITNIAYAAGTISNKSEDAEENDINIRFDIVVMHEISKGMLQFLRFPDNIVTGIVQIYRIPDRKAGGATHDVYWLNEKIALIHTYSYERGWYTASLEADYEPEKPIPDPKHLLCEYNLDTHEILTYTPTNYMLTQDELSKFTKANVMPLVQADNNGFGRDWCFLASMGMLINHFEGTEHNAHSIAYLYLNKPEVRRTDLNEEGYVPNSDKYNGNTVENIRKSLEYRGYKPSSTLGISYGRVKNTIDNGGIILAFFDRKYMHVDEETGDYIDLETTHELYGVQLNRHVIVVVGYNSETKEILAIDPSPLEEPPGPFTATYTKLTQGEDGTWYIPHREETNIEGTDIHKIYHLKTTLHYTGNVFENAMNEKTNLVGQLNTQLSSYACLASIINGNEDYDKSAADIAYDLLPKSVADHIIETEENIFDTGLGRPLNHELINIILGLRGYYTLTTLSYERTTLESIEEALDLGFGVGVTYRVYDLNGDYINTHFALIRSVNLEEGTMTVMDPTGVGSYKTVYKSSLSEPADYYGLGYTMEPEGLYRYSLNFELGG